MASTFKDYRLAFVEFTSAIYRATDRSRPRPLPSDGMTHKLDDLYEKVRFVKPRQGFNIEA